MMSPTTTAFSPAGSVVATIHCFISKRMAGFTGLASCSKMFSDCFWRAWRSIIHFELKRFVLPISLDIRWRSACHQHGFYMARIACIRVARMLEMFCSVMLCILLCRIVRMPGCAINDNSCWSLT